jgi:hypothetical protein
MKEKHVESVAPRAPDPKAGKLSTAEQAQIAAFGRDVWNRQGDGDLTDSLGRWWAFGIARNPLVALYISVGGPWDGKISVPYQAVGQASIGATATSPIRAAVVILDGLAPLPGQRQPEEQRSSNGVR